MIGRSCIEGKKRYDFCILSCCITLYYLKKYLLYVSFIFPYRNTELDRANLLAVVRVVHGTEEVHSYIRKAVLQSKVPNISVDNVHKETGEEECIETNVNGVWTLSLGTRIFDGNFEGIKVIFAAQLKHILIRIIV